MPPTKSLMSGTWASTLLPAMRSAAWPAADHLVGQCPPEERHPRRYAQLDGLGSDVGRRLDAQHRHAHGQEMLQQIAVVAGELDHEAVAVQPEPFAHGHAVAPRMLDPAGGIGREVGIFRPKISSALTYSRSWTSQH